MSLKGRKFTDQHRKRLSESHKGKRGNFLGKKHSKKTREKISSSRKGKCIGNTNGFKKGCSHWLGRHHSEETKKKISKAKLGKKYPEKVLWKNKKYVSWRKNKRNRLRGYLKKIGYGHTFGEWELLKKQYDYTCPCCNKTEPKIKLTEDHIIPLSKGGSDLIENIQPLCGSCNCKKYTKIIKY